MKRYFYVFTSCVLVILCTSRITSAAQSALQAVEPNEELLRAGAATRKITPPVGSIMGNSYGITVSTKLYDDLYAHTDYEKRHTK